MSVETPSGKQAKGGFKTDAYDGEKVRQGCLWKPLQENRQKVVLKERRLRCEKVRSKLQALVSDILPPATAIADYTIGHGKTVS